MTGDAILKEDFQMVADSGLPFEKLKNKTVVVTGATGLIGSLLVKNLLYCSRVHGLHVKVVAMIRNQKKAEEIFADELWNEELIFFVQDLTEPLGEFPYRAEYVIHAAADTVSKHMVEHPVENIRLSLNGTMSMLELAHGMQAEGMVYISSMEVYGSIQIADRKVTETDQGYVDLASARSCYPQGKRMCECLCNAYASQYGLPVKTARLAQTFGAGILKGENRVFAQFAKSALRSEDIVLHTRGLSEGNYVYTADAIIGILTILLCGAPGEAYNVANEKSHTTIADMAHMVAERIAGGRIQVVFDIPEDLAAMGYAPDVKMHLSSEKLRALGWQPHVGLPEAYERMMRYMKGWE